MPIDLKELAQRIEKTPASDYKRVGRESVPIVKLMLTEDEKLHIVAALQAADTDGMRLS